MQKMKLLLSALTKFLVGLVLVGAILACGLVFLHRWMDFYRSIVHSNDHSGRGALYQSARPVGKTP